MTLRRRTIVPAVENAEEASGEPVTALSNRDNTASAPGHTIYPHLAVQNIRI